MLEQTRRSELVISSRQRFRNKILFTTRNWMDVTTLHNCSRQFEQFFVDLFSVEKLRERERKKRKKERKYTNVGAKRISSRQSEETDSSISPRLRNGRVTSTRQGEVIGPIGDAGPIVEEDKQRQKTSTPVRPSMAPDDHPRSNAYS